MTGQLSFLLHCQNGAGLSGDEDDILDTIVMRSKV